MGHSFYLQTGLPILSAVRIPFSFAPSDSPMPTKPALPVLVLAVGLLLSWATRPPEPYAQPNGDSAVESLQAPTAADSTRPSSSADLVSADLRLRERPVPAGRAVEAALRLDVADGWHVNAHRPTFDYLIGTSLEWEHASDLTITDTRYPDPKALYLEFAGASIDVYEGQSAIFATVRPDRDAPPGDRRLEGRLRVQACNDKTCLRPSTVRAQLPVTVAEAGTDPTPTGAAVFETASSGPDWAAVLPFLRRYGALLAGSVLVLGTVLVVVVRSWQTGHDDAQ